MGSARAAAPIARVRWLLAKDLLILRRSPVMAALLVAYPVVIAVLIGLALSRPPGLPRVAVLNEIPPDQPPIAIGRTRIDPLRYERRLLEAITPVMVNTRAQALADVRSGATVAALIIPSSLPSRLASGHESAFVEVVYNGDAVNQALVQRAIASKLAQANTTLARQLEKVANTDIDLLLSGGRLRFLNTDFDVLGLRRAARTLDTVVAALPRGSPLGAPLRRVARFAHIAADNLGRAKAVIGAVGAPVLARQRTITGRRVPLDAYAVAVAVAITLMFVCLLLACGMVALEREENTFERLRRGLASPAVLLGEKVLLAAVCALAVGFAMLAGIGVFVALDWGRVGLWLLALAGGGLAFGTLGVALGGLVREVRAASLLALLVSLPLAFLALVPPASVASGLYEVIRVVSAVFPFKAALEAIDAAVNRSAPGVWVALGHLAAIAAGFGGLAWVALRR